MTTVSIIIPVFNEKDNICILIDRLLKILKNTEFEVIIVDDKSTDETYEIVNKNYETNKRISCIKNNGRKGLTPSVIFGVKNSTKDTILVMDGDLQHDENIIPDMLKEINNGFDLVVASRYLNKNSLQNWNLKRILISKLATFISKSVIKYNITDPMSGYFAVNKILFMNKINDIKGDGFKVLLELISLYNKKDFSLKITEVSYIFRERFAGESKFSFKEVLKFLKLVRKIKEN